MIHIAIPLRDIEKSAADMGVPLSYAIGARRNYLWKELDRWIDADVDHVTWDVLCVPRIWAIIGDLIKLQKDWYWKNKPVRTGQVTDAMKEQARAVPVTSLLDIIQGKALCLWHDDKRPSMAIGKSGKAVCYVCNKHFDPIDIVMKRDGKTYHEAIRRLCGV
jgi:hypothetical protein